MLFWKVSVFTEEAFIRVGHEHELSGKALDKHQTPRVFGEGCSRLSFGPH